MPRVGRLKEDDCKYLIITDYLKLHQDILFVQSIKKDCLFQYLLALQIHQRKSIIYLLDHNDRNGPNTVVKLTRYKDINIRYKTANKTTKVSFQDSYFTKIHVSCCV